MQRLRESVQNNLTALKNVIQYEILLLTDPFEAYKNFCKAIGNSDFITYPEYESWYMKIYHGDLDLDIEKEQKKALELEKEQTKKLTLTDLPVEMIDNVFKELEPMDLISTRHVSKQLREWSDRQKCDEMRLVDSYLTSDQWKLSDSHGDHIDFTICYNKTENGCEVVVDNKFMMELKGINFIEAAVEDLKNFDINSLFFSEHYEENAVFEREFQSKLCVDSLFICQKSPVMPLLNMMMPTKLRYIHIDTTVEQADFDEFTALDQWNHAKEATVHREMSANNLEKYLQMDQFTVHFNTALTRDQWTMIRTRMLESPTFEDCWIIMRQHPQFDIADIEAVFGTHYIFGDHGNRKIRVEIPGSTDVFGIYVTNPERIIIEREKI